MKKIRKILDKVLEILCSSLLVFMVLIVLYQIFTRVVLNNPNTITEELVRFLMVWVSLISSAYVVGKKSHLAVTLLSEKLNIEHRRLLDIIVQVLFLLFSLTVMVYGGIKSFGITLVQLSPSLSLPMGYIYLSVPISGLLICIYTVLNIFDSIDGSEG
ncbi:TRAP transporter small permease [Globicatella sp. PHS-GS-PNBC-21-1553]|uniref:TRAP transporter small permease n=1 Tax=Globicatella sp. PHS-GS-PNBC-21-1553 TaxID=2885764 RepID=UPI00298EF22A|nr:TRAP transporter small permease [Globicatella sp. PHS-GS-PNBC-21-1553]WPC09601.1 TRAP transporter small permease [Globicatella sp. PHS-GS-PNBC-21-1553]